jgi:hypothetical protein
MIDPSLGGSLDSPDDQDEDKNNDPGPSISNQDSVAEKTHQCDEEVQRLQEDLNAHSKSMQEIQKKLLSKKTALTAFKNMSKSAVKKKTPKDQSSAQLRPHQPISGEVKSLIEREIFENNKKQIEVARSFGILD